MPSPAPSRSEKITPAYSHGLTTSTAADVKDATATMNNAF
jgi:hypothetical protein